MSHVFRIASATTVGGKIQLRHGCSFAKTWYIETSIIHDGKISVCVRPAWNHVPHKAACRSYPATEGSSAHRHPTCITNSGNNINSSACTGGGGYQFDNSSPVCNLEVQNVSSTQHKIRGRTSVKMKHKQQLNQSTPPKPFGCAQTSA